MTYKILEPSYNYFFHSKSYDFSSKKDISFLLAHRGDVSKMENSVKSVFDLAKYPERIEVLIWIDDDDTESMEGIQNSEIINKYNVKTYIGERYGWHGLHLCIEELARKASGDIFFLWASDYYMMENNWDNYVYGWLDKVVIFKNEIYIIDDKGNAAREMANNYSAAITRRVYDITGRISAVTLSDVYIDYVSSLSSIRQHTPIKVAILASINEPYPLSFFSYMDSDINKDSLKIKQYLDSHGIEYDKNPYIFIDGKYSFSSTLTGGDNFCEYIIQFIDGDTNSVVYSVSASTNSISRVLRDWYTNWNIVITNSDKEIICDYKLFLGGKKVIMQMDEKASRDDVVEWLHYVDKFRMKHNCEIICATLFKESLRDKFRNIVFVEQDFSTVDIKVGYKIGRFNDVVDVYLHKEDISQIPVGKIASNILGIEFEEG